FQSFLREGLKLSKDYSCTENMLELLADTYIGCSFVKPRELNICSPEFEGVVSRAELVSQEFLRESGKWTKTGACLVS
ncbi:hypothetical protein, partial [Pseudomonas syringae group genomosp. 3]|uniref:hypothetical protein n=2 Tax=Pseudomonas syringae group genomosp. 3 TaxID=251701 RepID=UPI001C81F02F